jgi:hypothetical protein
VVIALARFSERGRVPGGIEFVEVSAESVDHSGAFGHVVFAVVN